MLHTHDISDSTEASSGRPLSDLRNFSRFGACPFCGAAMMASSSQASRRERCAWILGKFVVEVTFKMLFPSWNSAEAFPVANWSRRWRAEQRRQASEACSRELWVSQMDRGTLKSLVGQE